MLLLDSNVLLYAVDRASEFYSPCRDFVDRLRLDPTPSYLTWSICYEFLRVSTHPGVFDSPLDANSAWTFIKQLLDSPGGYSILTPTDRHDTVLAKTLTEIPEVRGNIMHDVHTAVLMREHGISQICTRDADFYRFPFLRVLDPLRL